MKLLDIWLIPTTASSTTCLNLTFTITLCIRQNHNISSIPCDMSDDNNLQEPLLERLSASPDAEPMQHKSTKRKRTAESSKAAATKPAKKARSKKSKATEDDDIDVESGINKAFAKMDNQLLSDYVAQKTRKFESDLSSVELEDRYISGILILTPYKSFKTN